MANVLLEMKNITKVFPGVKALDNVNLVVEEGEIHAICGENGAGKSTLIKILTGVEGSSRCFVFEKTTSILSTVVILAHHS